MKSYLIWLKSGNCIEGEMEDNEAKKLSDLFDFGHEHRDEFTDTQGTLHINLKEVSAIGINDIKENSNRLGY